MTQEDKALLLKDLCARLNTKLVCSIYRTDDQEVGYRDEILHGYCKGDIWYEFYFGEDCGIGIDDVSKIKPYLFPFSSMTEEEKEEYCQLQQRIIYNSKRVVSEDVMKYINWCYKKHLDINNLIPIGLAIDATGLNIY